VTIDQPLPLVSVLLSAAAGWAAWSRPESGLERGLKAGAIGALALYAYLRGMAPGALGIALILSAAAQLMPPRERDGWRSSASLLHFAAWAAFAVLLARDGLGRAALTQPLHAVLIAGALALGVLTLARVWRGAGEARMAAAADLGALTLMLAAAAALPFGLWPALLGALALFLAEAAALWQGFGRIPEGRALRPALWALAYAGQAAIASVFVH
jgi:hypothetical protein